METEFIDQSDLDLLAEQMKKKNDSFLDGRQFDIKAKKNETEVYVTVTLRNNDESFYYPVELRVKFATEELTPRKAVLLLVDYADLYYEDFLTEGENLLLPIDWASQQYEAVDFEIRGQILNKKLEKMADELLANENLN